MRKLLFSLFYLNSFLAFSQADSILLEQVDVSSARIPSEFNEKMRSVVVILKDEISAMPVTSLDELLEYALNTDVRQRGPFGVQSDVNIRGGSYEQLAIMLNGVRINDPQTGHHNLNIPLDLSCVSRIEILQGPGTRMYGPGAFSGAVNIITEIPNELGARIMAEGGDFGLMNGSLSAFSGKGGFRNMISGGYKTSSGYRYNTDFRTGNAFWFGKKKTRSGTFAAQAGYNDKAFGANSFYSAAYPDQFEQVRVLVSSVRFEGSGRFHIRPQFYYRRHQDRFELFRDGVKAASWYTGHNFHLTHVLGGEVSSCLEWKAGKTSLGCDYRTESVYSNKLGEPMPGNVAVPFEENAFFTKYKKREVATAFADHQAAFGDLICSGGVMGYFSNETGFRVFPGIDVSYGFNKYLSIYASCNNSIRLPSFTEMYYTGPVQSANKNILPEESLNTEAGIKYVSPGLRSGFTFFYRDGKNIIDWVRKSTAEKWTTANITNILTYGAEFNSRWNIRQMFKKSPVSSFDLNIVYNFLQKSSEDFYSLYALDYLKYKISAGVSHKIYRNFSASWTLLYQEREGSYTGTDGKEVSYLPFFVADGRVSWKYKGYKVFAEASNIFDNAYMDIGNLPMPGRWFRAGFEYSFSR